MDNSIIPFEINEILSDSTNSFDTWDTLFNLIIERKSSLNDASKLGFVINCMIRKLLECGCEKSQTVLRLVMMYQRSIRTGLGGIRFTPPGAQRLFDYIIEPLNLENNYQLDPSDGDDLQIAIDTGDLTLATLLVKYGKTYVDNRLYNLELTFLQKIMHYIWSRIFRYEISLVDCLRSASDVMYTMLYENGRIGNNERGFGRIFIILRILNNILLKRQEYHLEISDTFVNTRIQCLQLYYRAINEPFVPEEDIRDFLRYLFCNAGNREETVEELLSIYRGMFPSKSIQVYEPRSLKHQARCVVRNILSYQNTPLPNIVSQLNLPVTVKDLLLGACEFSS